MSKHVEDQPRSPDHNRLREYTRQERESGMHPAIWALHSRPLMRGSVNRKAAEYLRIARGRTV